MNDHWIALRPVAGDKMKESIRKAQAEDGFNLFMPHYVFTKGDQILGGFISYDIPVGSFWFHKSKCKPVDTMRAMHESMNMFRVAGVASVIVEPAHPVFEGLMPHLGFKQLSDWWGRTI